MIAPESFLRTRAHGYRRKDGVYEWVHVRIGRHPDRAGLPLTGGRTGASRTRRELEDRVVRGPGRRRRGRVSLWQDPGGPPDLRLHGAHGGAAHEDATS